MSGKRKFPIMGFVFFVVGLSMLNVNKGSAVTFMAIGAIFGLSAWKKGKEGDA